MNWNTAFYQWFLRELIEALRALEPGSADVPVVGEIVITPGLSGQHTRDATGVARFTRRESNLIPRPGQEAFVNPQSGATHALGDGTRRRNELLPTGGFVPPTPLNSFPTPTPPNPYSPLWMLSAPSGVERFGGTSVPTAALTQGAGGLNRVLGDPAECLWHRYSGFAAEAPGWLALYDTDNRMLGPNWFFPYASRGPDGTAGVIGLIVPCFDATAYLALPPAFDGNVPTFKPADVFGVAYWQFGKEPYARATSGHHLVVAYAQDHPPFLHEGVVQVIFTACWPVALIRGAPFAVLDAHPVKLAHDLTRWTPTMSTVGSTSVWRYHFTPVAAAGQTLGVDWAHVKDDGGGGTIVDVPADYRNTAVLSRMSDDVMPDGRQWPLKTWSTKNYLSDKEPGNGDQFAATGSIGPVEWKGLISQTFRYRHNAKVLGVTTRFGLVAYAPTAFDVHKRDGASGVVGETPVHSGVGYTLAGAFDNLTTDPAPADPPTDPQWLFDHDDPRRRHLIFMTQALRLLRLDPDIDTARLRLWWALAHEDHKFRVDPAAVGYPEETTDVGFLGWRQGIEYDFYGLGWATWNFAVTTDIAPTVPTVGRFTWDDFGPEEIAGIGLRMSHQEYFDDFEDGPRTIGRILTLVDPADLRSYFPPTAPAPHDVGFPTGTFNGADYDAYAAAVARLYTTLHGDLGVPYGGESTTFAGLPVSASGPYSADALIDPAGVTLGAVLAADHAVAVSVDGVPRWAGTLVDILGVAGEIVDASDVPYPHQRHLTPGWPFGVLVLNVGYRRAVMRARTRGDRRSPGDAPIVFSHWGDLDAP